MRIYLLCAFLLGALFINAQTSRLQGKILDENLGGEPVSFANIVLLKGDEQVAGTTSDLDGNYYFSNIEPGTYSILISYVGLPDLRKDHLLLLTDKVTVRDFTFPEQEAGLPLPVILVDSETYSSESYTFGIGDAITDTRVHTAEKIRRWELEKSARQASHKIIVKN